MNDAMKPLQACDKENQFNGHKVYATIMITLFVCPILDPTFWVFHEQNLHS
jgi:hypothetical protein